MLQVQNVYYKIGNALTLEHISFDVHPGETVVILGANGAGKSTLLKIITGTIRPMSGNIMINGKQLKAWDTKDLATFTAVLNQQNQLQLPFSVHEVVMMGRYPHFKRNESAEDNTIVRNALRDTGIEHLEDRNYLTLSGGEQQRVHLARVIAQVSDSTDQPRYLFMDEPSNSLDIKHQHSALQMAKSFAAAGNCVVAVIHDLNLALRYADKILLLQSGHLKAFGCPAEIMSEEIISSVYGMSLQIFNHPSYSHPIVMPATTTILN